METEPKYYDGYLVRDRSTETQRERDLACVNKSLIRQINERDAEIRGINAAYDLLETQVENLKTSNDNLHYQCRQLNNVIDQLQAANETLKNQVTGGMSEGSLFKLLEILNDAAHKMHTENDDLKQKNAKLRELYYGTGRRNNDIRSI